MNSWFWGCEAGDGKPHRFSPKTCQKPSQRATSGRSKKRQMNQSNDEIRAEIAKCAKKRFRKGINTKSYKIMISLDYVIMYYCQGRRSTRFTSYHLTAGIPVPSVRSDYLTLDQDGIMAPKNQANVWSLKDGSSQVADSTGFPCCGSSGSTSCPPIFGSPNPRCQ